MTKQNNSIEEPRILLVALSVGYGGADVRVFDMAMAFHGRFFYAVATLSNSPLHQKLTAAGLHTRPFSYARSDPRLLRGLYHLIKREQFTVVDAHNPQSQFWGAVAARLAKTAVSVATVHHAYGQVEPLRLLDRLYEQVLRLNIRWEGRFVTVSHTIYEYLRQLGVPSDKLALIHNTIVMDPPSSPPDFSWRQALGWGSDTTVVIVVGRLEVVKGHTHLLEAMHMAAARWPQLRCVLVGDGRLHDTLVQQIEELELGGIVQLLGFRKDVPALLRSSDIFCLSSLSEGLPYALLEAAVCKLPVVVTAVGGMAELLTDGQNAHLVPPSDPIALAEAFGHLVDNPTERIRLGEASHDLVKERFAPAVMVSETLRVYS